jgi:hypothetical protein
VLARSACWLSLAFGGAFTLLCFSQGCSSNNTVVVSGAEGGAPIDDPSLPPVAADQLGARCAGYGTGVDQTAAFPSDQCPAGVCLVDGRSFEFYCSADCDKVRCPDGWLCQATDNGVKHACFKDPSHVAATPDAGPSAVNYLDAKLPAYRANSSTATTLALADFKDPLASSADLVVVLVGSLWDFFSQKQLATLKTVATPRVTWVAILADGSPPNTPPTAADLAKWHSNFPGTTMLLDPNVVTLGAGFGTFQAFPNLIALDARTLKEVDRNEGALVDEAALTAQIATWRSKLPK